MPCKSKIRDLKLRVAGVLLAAGIASVLLLEGLWPAATSAGIARVPANDSSERVHFEDITQKAGINFIHYTGAFGKKYLPETMGPGCAFIDYDNDGYPTSC